MVFTDKEVQMIRFFYEHMGDYISSQEVGEIVNVSDRTARKYIGQINESLTEFGASIETKKGYGFKLVVTDDERFNPVLSDLASQQSGHSDNLLISEARDRQRFILNKLFLENERLTVDEYAAELFVSRSTIMNVLQSIRSLFAQYDLVLHNSVNEGIWTQGHEIEKRRFIMNYFFDSDQIDSFMNFNYAHLETLNISIETLFIVVLEECRNGRIQLSDYVMQNLVLHLALAIVRIKAGKTIESFESKEDLNLEREIAVANRIVARVEEVAQVRFPADESKYIALHLKSKSNKVHDANSGNPASDLESQLLGVLEQMESESDINLTVDSMLLMGLEAHFDPLLTRLDMGIPLKNPLLDEIYNKYGYVFDLTKDFFKHMPLLSEYDIDDHEWAYITLHILAAIERYRQNQRLKVMVICSTGLGSAQMLRNRMESEFGQSIQIVDVISYYQLNDNQLKDVDLIVSTIDISKTFFQVPVVRVSVFLNEEDIREIKPHIKDRTLANTPTDPVAISADVESLFNTYFHPSRFIVIENSISREQLVNQMIRRLTDCEGEDFVQEFHKQIALRERFGSLTFSDTVAFPHPSIPLGIHSEIVIALLPEGVYWDEAYPNIRFVILMSPSKLSNKGLTHVTDYFVHLVEDEVAQESLLVNASFDAFKQHFVNNIKI